MQLIVPAVLVPLLKYGFLTNYQTGMVLLLSVPIVTIFTIFILQKWLNHDLNMGWRPLNSVIPIFSLILLVFLYIIQNTLDISFINSLVSGQLRFIKPHFAIPDDFYSIASFIIMVFMAPILEEVLYRRIIFEKLMEQYGAWTSIVITSFLFALMHLDFHGILAYLVIAFVYTYIYYVTRNIWLNIFIHFIFNLISNFTRIKEYSIDDTFFEIGIIIYIASLIGLGLMLKGFKSITEKK